MSKLKIKGILLDLDGVIYDDDHLINGAIETISFLKVNKIPFRFITNTSIKTCEEICSKLTKMGLSVEQKKIFSTLNAIKQYLIKANFENVFLLLPENVKNNFPLQNNPSRKVDAVVIADMAEAFEFKILNKAFKFLLDGAELIAAHKNRYWKTNNNLQLDAGGFVKLLEYASGVSAKIIGKPEPSFFEMALGDLRLEPEYVLMVGDDIHTDIQGAQNCAIKSALVKTGKFKEKDIERLDKKPDIILNSIKDLPNILADLIK